MNAEINANGNSSEADREVVRVVDNEAMAIFEEL